MNFESAGLFRSAQVNKRNIFSGITGVRCDESRLNQQAVLRVCKRDW